jgi:hypothetical protein
MNFRHCALWLLAMTFALPLAAQTPSKMASAPKADALETRLAVRDLWVGHIFWVRNVVTAKLASDAKAEAAAEKQVVANAKSIAASIEPFYGKPASDKLFELLAGHYGAIKGYLDATAAGQASAQQAAVGKITDNAGQIAKFLSGANPNLPEATLMGLLSAHGAHHVEQIRQLKAGQFDAEAQTAEAMRKHMYVIADALVGAIARQFPDRFKASAT